jgi:hypothetical protein
MSNPPIGTNPPLPPPEPPHPDTSIVEWATVLVADGTVLSTGGGSGEATLIATQNAAPPEVEVIPIEPGRAAIIRQWQAYDVATGTFFYDQNKLDDAGTTIEEIEKPPPPSREWWRDAPPRPPRRAT